MPLSGRFTPLFHADAILAIPTTSQYASASPTVIQNIATASPYGDDSVGSKGVADTSKQMSSLLDSSTARSRVVRVVRSRLSPHITGDPNAKGPAARGQYDAFSAGRGWAFGGRRGLQNQVAFENTPNVRTVVAVKRVAGHNNG